MADKADWKQHAADLENELAEMIRIKDDWVERCNRLREAMRLMYAHYHAGKGAELVAVYERTVRNA